MDSPGEDGPPLIEEERAAQGEMKTSSLPLRTHRLLHEPKSGFATPERRILMGGGQGNRPI